MTAPYSAKDDRGLFWNDGRIGIDWPIKGDAILSEKDKVQPKLADLAPCFHFSEVTEKV